MSRDSTTGLEVAAPAQCLFKGSDQEKTFGPTISGLIHKHLGPERLVLWDSKQRGGRPDTMKILKEAYATWDAEGNLCLFVQRRVLHVY